MTQSCFHSSETGREICPIISPFTHGQFSRPPFQILLGIGLSLPGLLAAKTGKAKKWPGHNAWPLSSI
jgi:hypothetical protein